MSESNSEQQQGEFTVAQLVDIYLHKMKTDSFEFSDMRSDMENIGIPEEDISTVIRLIDSQIQRDLEKKSSNQKANAILWMGVVIAALGTVITLVTYFGTGSSYVVMYGAIGGGVAMVFMGLAKKR